MRKIRCYDISLYFRLSAGLSVYNLASNKSPRHLVITAYIFLSEYGDCVGLEQNLCARIFISADNFLSLHYSFCHTCFVLDQEAYIM